MREVDIDVSDICFYGSEESIREFASGLIDSRSKLRCAVIIGKIVMECHLSSRRIIGPKVDPIDDIISRGNKEVGSQVERILIQRPPVGIGKI